MNSLNRFLQRESAPFWVGLAVWIFFSVYQVGFDSPDEHYPTLEPAGFLLFGYWNVMWEWPAGLRSWIHPYFLYSLLKPFVEMGIENRLWLDAIARIFNSVWALSLTWSVGVIARVVWASNEDQVRRIRYWTILAWPLMVWGTRHGSDNFGIPPMLVAFAFFLTLWNTRRIVAAGVCFGLTFCLRYPAALPMLVGTVSWFFLQPKPKLLTLKKFSVVVGIAVLVAGLGLGFDAFMQAKWFGAPKIPAWEFFKFNIIQKSGNFHTSPWWELVLYSLLLWVPAFGWVLWLKPSVVKERAKEQFWPITVVVVSNLLFMLIRHKELRFIFPLIPFMVLSAAPLLTVRFRKFSLVMAGLLTLVVLGVYAEPHGGIVRCLDSATAAASSVEKTGLVRVGRRGEDPQFFRRKPLQRIELDAEDWRKVCAGDLSPVSKQYGPEKEEWVFYTAEACSGRLPDSCRLVDQFTWTLGYRLRQIISSTPMPQYVYVCKK